MFFFPLRWLEEGKAGVEWILVVESSLGEIVSFALDEMLFCQLNKVSVLKISFQLLQLVYFPLGLRPRLEGSLSPSLLQLSATIVGSECCFSDEKNSIALFRIPSNAVVCL